MSPDADYLKNGPVSPVQRGQRGEWEFHVLGPHGEPILGGELGNPPELRDALKVLSAALLRKPMAACVWANPKFGIFRLGMGPDGYPQPVISENGGSVVVPYGINPDTGELFIGTLLRFSGLINKRRTATKENPRGFKGSEETYEHAAEREANAEAGVLQQLFTKGRFFSLGAPGNFNRAYNETNLDEQGIKYFALGFEFGSELVPVGARSNREFRLAGRLCEDIKETFEKFEPQGLLFQPEGDIETVDIVTEAGIRRLQRALEARGEIAVRSARMGQGRSLTG